MTFATSKPFDKSHPAALAVYCSDGRFTDAVEELLHSLGHPRLDTLTLPGGPALLDLSSAGFSQLEASRQAATFLIRGHKTTKVVLIAHYGCGFYAARFRMESQAEIEKRQILDMHLATRWLTSAHDGLEVAMYYAQVKNGKIVFYLLEAGSL